MVAGGTSFPDLRVHNWQQKQVCGFCSLHLSSNYRKCKLINLLTREKKIRAQKKTHLVPYSQKKKSVISDTSIPLTENYKQKLAEVRFQ